jgi:ubiquitin C-terminal hydrolase
VQNSRYLVIHLVRFDETYDEYGRRSVVKNHDSVFIDHTLSLAPYTRTICPQTSDYELYGIVHHSGSLSGGHYVSEVKTGDGRWYRCNDSSIT